MAGQDNWINEPRDDRGRWTTGGASAVDAIRAGMEEALAALPMPVRDQFDIAVSRMARNALGDVAAHIGGRADGALLLADTLNQLSLNRTGRFGHAAPDVIARLRTIADGLRAGRDHLGHGAAVAEFREALRRPDIAARVVHAIREVEQVKIANIAELARVLENEAGSIEDQPIMDAVGHTVLNRMRRNGTASVGEVSGQYAHGRRAAAPVTRNLATMLINGQLPDITGGATHFYQPYAMATPILVPKAADGHYLTENPPSGYEYVPGVSVKDRNRDDVPVFTRRPVWADGMRQVPMPGIPDRLGKFFVAPGDGHVR